MSLVLSGPVPLHYLLPHISLPLVEIVLSLVPLGVALPVAVYSLSSELFHTLVDLLAHLIELLVGGISQAKDSEFDAFQKISLLGAALLTEPSVELLSVIARVPLVVGGYHNYNECLLWKGLGIKVFKVNHTC